LLLEGPGRAMHILQKVWPQGKSSTGGRSGGAMSSKQIWHMYDVSSDDRKASRRSTRSQRSDPFTACEPCSCILRRAGGRTDDAGMLNSVDDPDL
jgi:hypothetical protein